LYVTNIVVFLTAFSVRVGLLSSETKNGDGTAKENSEFSQELPVRLYGEVSLKCSKRK